MVVKVIPMYPIPGILPKNKYIDVEMTLDLNKAEMIHCMQYGNLYDVDGNIIDRYYLNKMNDKYIVKSQTIKEIVKDVNLNIPIQETLEKEKNIIENIIEQPKKESESFVKNIKPEYKINILSITKGDYITLETEFITNAEKLVGNLYGLLDIYQGPKPTIIEYKSGENWIRFAKKFSNFEELSNGDKFIFRIIPKNNELFKFNLSIKEKNEICAYIVGDVNPANL